MTARKGDQERDERSREEPRRRDAAAPKARVAREILPSLRAGEIEGRQRRDKRKRAQRGSGEQLHAEIVAAAKELLAKSGSVDAMSIRAVADAVGVTAPSIYLHFEDKDDLISAVVADVFTELDDAMIAAAEGLSLPLERLRAFGLAYVEFAITHPEHYRIAAMDSGVRPNVDEVLATSGFKHFSGTVKECMDAGIFEAGDPLPVALELWAAAHGIASLLIIKPYLPWGDKEEFIDRVLCSAALGRATAGLIGGDVTPPRVTEWLAAQRSRAGSD